MVISLCTGTTRAFVLDVRLKLCCVQEGDLAASRTCFSEEFLVKQELCMGQILRLASVSGWKEERWK